MKTKTLGIVTAIIGVLMLIYTGFNYVTEKNVVDIGPMQMSVDQNHHVQWSPIAGAVLLIGGIILVAIDRKK